MLSQPNNDITTAILTFVHGIAYMLISFFFVRYFSLDVGHFPSGDRFVTNLPALTHTNWRDLSKIKEECVEDIV